LTFFFSSIGIGSSLVASEINRYYNENDESKDYVIQQLIICNLSTALFCKHNFIDSAISIFDIFRLLLIRELAKEQDAFPLKGQHLEHRSLEGNGRGDDSRPPHELPFPLRQNIH